MNVLLMSAKPKDPLDLVGLEPAIIELQVEDKKNKKKAPATELEKEKEKRLQLKEQRLSSSISQINVKPQLPVQEIEEVDKSALLDKIVAYRDKFPNLKKRNTVSAKSCAEDLYDELHYIEMQLGYKKDNNLGALLMHGSMHAVEYVHNEVFNPFNLNLNGLAKVTKDNMSEFQPILDELMIKYGTGMYVGPEMRLVLAMGAMVVTVHSANSGDPRIAVALEKMNQTVKMPASSANL